MTEDTKDLDFVEMEKSTRRRRGRPKGSENKNADYKRKMREQEKARKVLWEKGVLNWKLDSNQMDLYDAYYSNTKHTDLTWMTSRQIGKSWTVCVIILEELIRNPGWKIAYIAPELGMAREIVEQTFNQILEDCPEHLRPKFNSQTNKWIFPNGSELKLAGTDNRNANKIRGNRFHRVFIDEFAFLAEYNYVISSCVTPTITSVPGSFIVFISSPPETPDHESNMLIDKAEEDETIIKKNIYTCPRFSPEHIEKIISRYVGGKDSIDFRREYMVERIADVTKLVIPEATKEKMLETVADVKRPQHFTIVEGFDWGVIDNVGGLFGYVDYDTQTLVIEDELFMDGIKNTTEDMAKEIKLIEDRLWGHHNNMIIQRPCDNNLQIINDMCITYNLTMFATKKDNLIAQVNHVRNLLKNNQIIIASKCVNLIEQIQSAQWQNASKKMFSRRNGHHYDLLAALIYLVRNANMTVNPFPSNFIIENGVRKEIPQDGSHFISPKRKFQEEPEWVKFMKSSMTYKKR